MPTAGIFVMAEVWILKVIKALMPSLVVEVAVRILVTYIPVLSTRFPSVL